ncbi:MAG TPA: redoxin family protein [Candidatus Acidoferrum sp.]|nr:redoxin family protein [Candidatus Acidoferrum sp.]
MAQALAQGDLYLSKRKYERAFDAYQKADKLSHHTSAAALLKIATIEKKVGAFSEALDEAKKAIKAAGDNKAVNAQVLQFRASLLAQMAGKPTDKKLKEAEEELRQALALDSTNALTHLDLGMILLRQERDAEGISELNTYITSPGAIPTTIAETRLVIANPIRARMPFAPKFSFTTHDNRQISNASLHGRVVLLDFWGSWCPPCRESVPILRDLNKKYWGNAFQLVGSVRMMTRKSGKHSFKHNTWTGPITSIFRTRFRRRSSDSCFSALLMASLSSPAVASPTPDWRKRMTPSLSRTINVG